MAAGSHVRSVLAAALAATVAGCAINPPPTTAELQQQALPHTTVPAAWKADYRAAGALADGWLKSFNDPALSALVAEALAYNADLQVAAARVEQAAGYVDVASGALYPTVGVAGVYSGKSGSGGGLNAVFLNAGLELDVWGRIRYAEAAAVAQSAAVAADYAYARQSLAALAAKGWFVAIEAGGQQALIDDALRAARELQRLAEERLRIGSGDEQAVAEAKANVGSYRDALRQAVLAREQALRALELLLGRYPAAEITVAQRLAPAPAPVIAGVPAGLLERRPDVVAAERRVAAAFARVGEAKAALLPRISLSEPDAGPRRQPPGTDLPGRRAAGAGGDPHRRAEGVGGQLRARRATLLRRGRECAGGRSRARRSRCDPGGGHRRQRAGAGTRPDPVSRRPGGPARGRAAADR
ncbi:MAG: TolC family protein, partial [Burkholderiaceae bacterium]|nr:TolC family protein [Burkholderiaceae bacterium]